MLLKNKVELLTVAEIKKSNTFMLENIQRVAQQLAYQVKPEKTK